MCIFVGHVLCASVCVVLCVYVCVRCACMYFWGVCCVHLCVYVYVVYACVYLGWGGEQRQTLGVCLRLLSTFCFFEKRSLTEPELINMARLTSQWASKIFLSLSLSSSHLLASHPDCALDTCCHIWLLTVSPGVWTQVLKLVWQVVYQPSHLPNPAWQSFSFSLSV